MVSKNGLSIVVLLVAAVMKHFNIDISDNDIMVFLGELLQVYAFAGIIWHQIAERPNIKAFIFKRG